MINAIINANNVANYSLKSICWTLISKWSIRWRRSGLMYAQKWNAANVLFCQPIFVCISKKFTTNPIHGEWTPWLDCWDLMHFNFHFIFRVCDVCARFFKCSKSYERHYQVEHTNIDQRVQCDLCRKWFKHLDTLKDHIRRHYAATETCKYCGRVSSNKKSLRLHIRNVHADIDSSVKTRNEFPCSVCGKIFKKKQTLRVSVRLSIQMTFKYIFSVLVLSIYRNTQHYILVKPFCTPAHFARRLLDPVQICTLIENELIQGNTKRSVSLPRCRRLDLYELIFMRNISIN